MCTAPSMPKQSKTSSPLVLGEFTYSDGKIVKKVFQNKDKFLWYAHNEGDHLVFYTYVEVEDA